MTTNGAPTALPTPSLSTRALHADHPDHTTHPNYPVAPALSLSTTFRSPHPHSSDAALLESAMRGEASLDMQDPSFHIYSRYSSSTNLRAEKVLSQIMGAHALTYSSGLSASYAALTFYAPRVVAIRRGYHGVHVGLDVYSRGREVKVIDLDDDYSAAMEGIDPTSTGKGGLLVWVETPLNPSGEARDLSKYVRLAQAVNAPVVVDSTFAPPPLQDPFTQGADMVMHSGTKYFGGHSDLLCGVLAVKDKKSWDGLWSDRTYLGSTLGSMESYLLLRSLRTLTVRVAKQSATATELAKWLHSLTLPDGPVEEEDEAWGKGKVVGRTTHSSLQPRTPEPGSKEDPSFDPSTQMPGGHAPTFAFRTTNPAYATWIPHLTEYFTPATSLGGVESLLEHRVKSDAKEDPRVVRVSVGLEDVGDLKADLRGAFGRVLQMEKEGKLK
ncbi:Cys/Met metabolism, pyridoxal phosphate-dependent enzyme [Kalmanozyma brasiliensis GHG001]|uniref:Cystathionine beta-lyase n=1 Tax=Kalmanozyma brasiliensis (strain GHG001) TaxID=1365824 RepID=V5ER98_KALBG|nr:Cys/Met metabolism, pyridoxal phosphate-dependent enzyme [Kalmanozyma brasiliensis GHG001]EST05468.1 Cys/Met metabolism, pyridoxal phosphate-dependent enzyme [Kalmanozyma brasiliensis GHG001]